MATFGGVTFGLKVRGGSFAQEGEVTERHIPGGHTSYIDRAGRKLPRIQGEVVLASFSDFTSLRAQLHVSGSLVYAEGTFAATLLGLRRTTTVPSGKQLADAEWLLESA